MEFNKMEMPMGPPLSIRLSPEQVEELIVKYGFRKDKVIEAGPYHYQMVLVRD